jgi:two-component system, cell cycle response regulator DivK
VTKRPLVLIVDDNDKNRKLARDVLQVAGLATLEAATGAEGIAAAAEHMPNIVLLDLRLSDMHGVDVARALRDRARTANIPVVALSALQPGADIDWLLAEGFAGSIEKPIDIKSFPEQVRRYLSWAA